MICSPSTNKTCCLELLYTELDMRVPLFRLCVFFSPLRWPANFFRMAQQINKHTFKYAKCWSLLFERETQHVHMFFFTPVFCLLRYLHRRSNSSWSHRDYTYEHRYGIGISIRIRDRYIVSNRVRIVCSSILLVVSSWTQRLIGVMKTICMAMHQTLNERQMKHKKCPKKSQFRIHQNG